MVTQKHAQYTEDEQRVVEWTFKRYLHEAAVDFHLGSGAKWKEGETVSARSLRNIP